jgi:flagellar protein FlaF
MQSAAQAYARTAQATANPRELEAQLLLRAATKLQTVESDGAAPPAAILSAVRYNRKLWQILFGLVIRDDNPLPQEIKQNLVNLAGFVIKHSMALEIEPATTRLGILITINREIAAGLRGG